MIKRTIPRPGTARDQRARAGQLKILVLLPSLSAACRWVVGESEIDFGRFAAFLASDDARFMTGQMLGVDGGV
jgi:NAD(P)-dependent dehydrogenase (short-subunit alcohol dehydrogenase family)